MSRWKKLFYLHILSAAEYGLRVWAEVWALRACGLHFDACIYKIIIKTLSVHCFPMRIRL